MRDLADWTIQCVETGQAGIYNATGPQSPLPMGALLETCRQVSGSDGVSSDSVSNADVRFTWLSEEFLLANQVQPWTELPLWLPESDPTLAGMDQVSDPKSPGRRAHLPPA